MNVREALEFAKKNRVQVVDLKFVDLIGTWQHFTIPANELTEDLFKDGSGLDGSSIRGWKAINNSDMLVVPDPATACLDPFTLVPTLSLIGNVVDPISRETYERDPRYIAQKAEKYLQSTKIGDTSYWGPEAEFFIFDQARYDQTSHSGYYYIDSDEGVWNMGQDGVNLGGKIRHKEGYFPVPPTDTQQDIRTEMILEMEKAGIAVEKHHHEVATAGQAEIDIRFDSLVQHGRQDDDVQVHRQERRAPARQDRHLHAEADLRRQRQRHAHAPEYLERGEAALCREGIRGSLADVPALHRRHPQACAGIGGDHQSDHELLQAADAGIRSAGAAGLFQPEPVRRYPDSDVLPESEGEADRGPFPRSGRQSVPGVLRHADGRPGRHREQDQSGRTGREGPVRSGGQGSGQNPDHAGQPR